MRRSGHAGPPPSPSSPSPSPTGNLTFPTGPRVVALAFGGLLAASYLRTFYYVVDVVGGVGWLLLSVGAALVVATVLARSTTVRTGTLVGTALAIAGVLIYVVLVPEIHDDLFSVSFVQRWLAYLTGISVLEFRRVDLWAIVVSPGPAFLSWLLLLKRRYDGSALVGGLMLGFFALTGDAGPTTTLVGMTSLLGLLGVGTVDREGGTLAEVARVGFVVGLGVVIARWIHLVPDSGMVASAGRSGGGGGGDSLDPAVAGDLDNADEQARIHGSISLSPRVLFTIEADAPDYWHVAAYDRYTGSDWIRTGGADPYDGPLDPPPGEATRNHQTVTVERPTRTFPAAWKPIEVDAIDHDRVRVTDLEGLVPSEAFEPGDRYEVTSRVSDRSEDRLSDASAEFPPAVRERYLQLPESTADRVRELAREIGGSAATPYDAAVAVRRWLVDNKSYDLEVERPSGDVVDEFLTAMDGGYCVYFASAMVVLLRALEVPARFVLGYETGQPVDENRWVVRGLDSHAWVEVYVPGIGWTRFDPTPNTDRGRARRAVLTSARNEAVDGVDTNESRRAFEEGEFAEFRAIDAERRARRNETNRTTDRGNQTVAVGGEAGAPLTAAPEAGDAAGGASTVTPEGPVETWLARRDRIDLLVGAASVALGLHWVGAFERGYRAIQLRWQRPTESPREDVIRAYERLELLLARRFRPRRADETRRRYVDLAEGLTDDEGARRVVDLYERASYAGTVTRAEADDAIRIVDALVTEDG